MDKQRGMLEERYRIWEERRRVDTETEKEKKERAVRRAAFRAADEKKRKEKEKEQKRRTSLGRRWQGRRSHNIDSPS
jgi:hypothetical protein